MSYFVIFFKNALETITIIYKITHKNIIAVEYHCNKTKTL